MLDLTMGRQTVSLQHELELYLTQILFYKPVF